MAMDVLFRTQWWAGQQVPVIVWILGLSVLLGLITWQVRAATPAAAATGTAITASLMYSTLNFPYQPWHTALIPTLAVSLLAFVSTRIGRAQKVRFGTAEKRNGRSAAQIAANLGTAALVASEFFRSWLDDAHILPRLAPELAPLAIAALAALAEAAADTVSSELGQVLGGRPRMITTFRAVEPGTDGAISIAGTLAGIAAASTIAGVGTWALQGGLTMFAVSAGGAVFGLFFDSLLGATLENAKMLNNDAVNFLSTASAAAFAIALLTRMH
jgi:uncharacterized protein (TIGR00297 family)